MASNEEPIIIYSSKSEDHKASNLETSVDYFTKSGRTTVKRKGSGRLGGGIRCKRSGYTMTQARALRQGCLDRPACVYMLLICYPRGIDSVTQLEFQIHLDRLLRIIRSICPGIEYLWTREFSSRRNTPHIHILLSDKLDSRVVRNAWKRAVRATHQFQESNRSPFVGFSRMRQGSLEKRADYVAKLKWHGNKLVFYEKAVQKKPPPGIEFSSGGVWGASKVRGKLHYKGTASEMKEKIRRLRLIATHIERKKGLAKGTLQITSRSGKAIYGTGKAMLETMKREPELWNIKDAQAFAKLQIKAVQLPLPPD